jgi:hypothetical protein
VPLVCSEAIVGDDSLPGAGVAVRLRLFVSPVKPSLTQVGAEEPLLAIKAVCASSDVFAAKYASLPPPSPNTPHSVVFQFEDCSLTRQPGHRELFNYNETPSSRCSSSRDPYTVVGTGSS